MTTTEEKTDIIDTKKKSILLITIAIVFSLLITLLAVSIYQHGNLPPIGNRVVQNVTYIVMLGATFLLMKVSGKQFKEYGLFREKLMRQILIGFAISGIALVLFSFIGWRPSAKESICYLILSQILVGFSEELLFRGLILTLMRDIVKNTNQAVVLTAVLFGVWHFPISHSVSHVVSACLIGAVYGALRTALDDDVIGIPSLAIAHCIWNVMI